MFTACVLNVLIASPSDTISDREAVRDAIREWNDFNASATAVVLLPLLWETHSTPQMGDRPQSILNKQLVNRADLLIALFWMRLGNPTGAADPGTVEEIREFMDQEKPVMIYFSEAPPGPVLNLDTTQIEAVKAFRPTLELKGSSAPMSPRQTCEMW